MSDMTAAVSGAQGRRIFVNRRTKTIIFAALIFFVILGVYLSGALLSMPDLANEYQAPDIE